MPVRLSCPSCNTAFTLPELPPDRRATCPRCGDAFAVRTWEDVGPEATAAEPQPAPAKPAVRRSLTPFVVARLGLGVEQIDHIAGGTSLGDRDVEFRLTLVVVLRDPLADPDEFLDKIKAQRKVVGGRERFKVQLGQLTATLTVVSPTVLVFGL